MPQLSARADNVFGVAMPNPPEEGRNKISDNLTPLYPNSRIKLDARAIAVVNSDKQALLIPRRIQPGEPVMPSVAYAQLLAETMPARVQSDEEYDLIRSRFGDLLGKRRRTIVEDKLMDLLGVLIEDYDRRHCLPPDESTPADRLQFLLPHSGKTPADLPPVFGRRSHVNEAIDGKRKISAEQARKTGQTV
jgi:HTH-type transcriptional regulator / antitoxin HigA